MTRRCEQPKIPPLHQPFFSITRLTLYLIRYILYSMAWKVDFYEDQEGNAPVEEFLDGLPEKQSAKLVALIKVLEQQGPDLPFPYSSGVEGRIRELRTQFGKTNLRILYFADKNRVFVLLHGVVKNTAKLEKSDIEKARNRMGDHNKRLEKKK